MLPDRLAPGTAATAWSGTRRFQPAATRAGGYTLVELLIALAIFAVLGLASWQVTNQVIRTKGTLEGQGGELRQLQKTLWLLTQDLQSVVDRPIRDNHGTREPAMTSVIPGFNLVLTRNGRANPLQLPRSELQRVAYGIEEGDAGKQLIRYSWPVLDRAPRSEPLKQVLLESIQRLEIQFVDHRGQTAFYWPPTTTADDDGGQRGIPAGIRLRLDTLRWGEIQRVIQIRDVTAS